jgi:hypothetical protein
MKLSELPSKPPKILLYGEVGAGKTALGLTLGENCQVIDMDDGLKTGLTLKDDWLETRKKVDVKQYFETDPAKKAEAFTKMKQYVYSIPQEIQAKRYPFQALLLDSLTTFGDSAVAYVMANSGKIGQNPEIQHWGLAFTEIKNVLAVLRTLPIVVVLIAHEQSKTTGKGQDAETKLEIAIPGKNLPSQICRYFDELWYLKAVPVQQGKRQYVLKTISDAFLTARSRSQLPDRTDTKVGMWELIKLLGYVPPKMEVKV